MSIAEAKIALDKVIRKARVHFYKPIQIAEILRRHRLHKDIKPSEVETYRLDSRRWRDEVSQRLVGSRSTSSSRYQDDLFNENAVPPRHIATLAELNRETNGGVEFYIYRSISTALSEVAHVVHYIMDSDCHTFDVAELLGMTRRIRALRRSCDKIYEIVTYALFQTLVDRLGATVTLSVQPSAEELLVDFRGFASDVLGLGGESSMVSAPAKFFRAGVANAADTGVDIWANFGPIVQIKHVTLDLEEATALVSAVQADRIIVVCRDCDANVLEALFGQLGWSSRLQTIVTESQIVTWYGLAMSDKHGPDIGAETIGRLREEFEVEFPSVAEIASFIRERQYSENATLPEGW